MIPLGKTKSSINVCVYVYVLLSPDSLKYFSFLMRNFINFLPTHTHMHEQHKSDHNFSHVTSVHVPLLCAISLSLSRYAENKIIKIFSTDARIMSIKQARLGRCMKADREKKKLNFSA